MKGIRHFGALAGLCAGLICLESTAAETWQVVQASSSVTFSAVQQGSRFTGKFEEFDATIDFDPGRPEAGRIIGVVQAGSVNTRDYDRDATLADPDWFDTSNHPEARFESTSIEPAGDGTFVANGELTIKGKTNPAELRFTFEASKSGTAEFAGTMRIDRFDFNVGEGWNDTSWIGQHVDVQVDLSLTR